MRDARYSIESILRACELLHSFRDRGEVLRLRDLVERTNISKPTAFRTLFSLVEGGMLERVGRDQYRLRIHLPKPKGIRLGYAAMTENSVFSRDVTEGLRVAAGDANVELLEFDNRYSPKVAIQNAEVMVKEKVDVAVEVQIHEQAAPLIAEKFREAGIPLIAVDIPHPGAVFVGGNNYLAGRIGGRALGKWALRNWGGAVDAILLLGLSAAGAVPAARMTGFAVGIREMLPDAGTALIQQLDGKGGYVESLEAVQKFLQQRSLQHVLVGAMNDASALGALRALEESGHTQRFAVVGQNSTAAARAEIRRPGSNLIGSVAFFPENYGAYIVKIAQEIVSGRSVPPATFTKHVLITRTNVDHYYPNDALITTPDSDTLLWKFFH